LIILVAASAFGSGDALALMIDRPDGTLGPKVKPWNGRCERGAPTETDEAATRTLRAP
jgi:hypothetical protein